ncbi:type VI secretion system Vgr family protein [Achromobacter sp. Bel]|uniref:type VI secretion system Vgr family protein n=1 Tax=Achromobacter sp. Bel TaxID=2727415 RepID=UPI00145F54A7|nr:type VI secretion system Vgr family protein [Achromobacter sp. Bel]NMK49607.1 type VI secretion system tip protein VgrG [Achromobacter sp. Bel]
MDSTATKGVFSSAARLYRLEGEGALAALQVEGWVAREALSGVAQLRIVALADNAGLALHDMISRPVTLWTTRADGSETSRSGLIREAELLSGDAGLARYRLTVVPWLWLATQQRASRVFEDKSVLDIVRYVLDSYEGYVTRIAPGVDQALADLAPRPYVTQYRETDYEFISRLLAEAGLGWTVVEAADVPAKHAVLIFTDSRNLDEDAESASGGIRFHRTGATETRDTVQAIARRRRRIPDRITVLGWHASSKRAIAAEALVNPANGDDDAAGLEWYEPLGHGSVADEGQARRQATLAMEAVRVQAETFVGQGGVRTFRSGTRFMLQGMSALGPAKEEGFEPVFALDRVEHVGINNLPPETRASLAQRLGGLDAYLVLDDDAIAPPGVEGDAALALAPDAAVLAKAREVGYANRFDAVRCDRPWRPELPQTRGARLAGAPSVHGVHTAVVTDAEGTTQAKGQDEILRNHRGDVRVRFHWQADGKDGEAKSRWVRVAQRQSGAGMGMSFVPRIGQEVLVRFLDDDVDQPVVIGALYNGRGEGGTPATPGGRPGGQVDTQVYAAARDGMPSAQANLAAGNAPAWHGAAGGDENHRNAAALTGFKSKEFGGSGYNQIVFDDTDDQLRTQIKSTQDASELNLGHLIHQAGNYRGGLRGLGIELRTDGYGAVRGGAGVLLSTYASDGNASAVGDAAGVQALASQTDQMARSLDAVVGAHQGLRLATVQGTKGPDASVPDTEKAPLAAMHRMVSGTVAGDGLEPARADASAKHTQAAEGKVPHSTDPVVLMAARAGLAQIAAQHMQYVAGDTVHFSSGKDQNLAVMGALRLHTGQGLGIVAGLQQGGADSGLDLISATGDVDVQAQHDILRVQAQKDITIGSAQTAVDYAAPKRIRIANAAGASIVLEGGNITVTAPGRIDVKTGNKQFSGPDRMPYAFPQFTVCKQCVLDAHDGVQSITDKV